MAGATRELLVVENVRTADLGVYSVRASNLAGSVETAGAALSLAAPPATPIVDSTVRGDPLLQGFGVPCALLPLPDDRVLVALGRPNSSTLVRLLPDGSLDSSFRRSTITSVEPQLVRQADGRIIVTGGRDTRPGQPMTFVRLEPDGSPDSTFAPADSNFFRLEEGGSAFDPPPTPRVTLQPDGKLLLYADTGRLARLLPDGSADPEFTISRVGRETNRGGGIALMPDGKIYRGVSYAGLDRLLPNGLVDPEFSMVLPAVPPFIAGSNGFHLFRLADGRLRVTYRTWMSTSATSFAIGGGSIQLLAGGTLDSSDPRPLPLVWPHAPLGPAGEILSGGLNVARPEIFGLYAADGATRLDINWGVAPGRDGRYVAAFARDGRIWIGGDFIFYNGVPTMRVARLNRVASETAEVPILLGTWTDDSSVLLYEPITLRAAVNSNAPVTYEWNLEFLDSWDSPTTQRTVVPYLTIDTRAYGVRRWSVRAVNSAGASSPMQGTFTVEVAKMRIVSQSTRVSAAPGRDAHLVIQVSAGSVLNRAEWQRNGAAVPVENIHSGGILPADQIGSVYMIRSVTPGDAGVYAATLIDIAGNRVASRPIEVVVGDAARFANLSIRSHVGAGESAAVVGFVIPPGGRRNLLVRGIGPTLAQFGVELTLADPQLELFNHLGAQVMTNDDWWNGSFAAGAFDLAGAFRLSVGSKDAAMLPFSLFPGSYTVRLTDTAGRSGVGLIELYEADNVSERLLNLSARVQAGTGESAAIAGFVIAGPAFKRVLIRAAGPALVGFGITDAVADPHLVVRDSSGRMILENNDWETGAGTTGSTSAELVLATASVGAFTFARCSRDAAAIVLLPPGSYTATVSGDSDRSRVALLELYELQ